MKSLLITLSIVLGMPVLRADAADIVVDCSRPIGTFRALQGVNSGPIQAGETLDLSDRFREIGVPLTRLHDCHWPNADVVDMHAVFPDAGADPSRASSYRFERTDDYIRSIRDVRSAIVYRLGESIEHSKRKDHVNPPSDPQRWAEACAGIVRHYDLGWAGGMQRAVSYWEIWNEPENRPDMWTGNDQQFLDLYVATARAIKQQEPDARVGGPGFGHVGRLEGDRLEPTPFVRAFLARCREDGAALDFFSWHCYTDDAQHLVRMARAVRRLLDEHGFARTESHLNEWSYLPDHDWRPMLTHDAALREHWYQRQGGAEGAAFAAAALMLLQDAPVDAAAYYSADSQGFGLFTEHGVPKKAFYALKAFHALCEARRRLRVEYVSMPGLVVVAGMSDDRSRLEVLASNIGPAPQTLALKLKALPWHAPTLCRVKVLDAHHDLAEVRAEPLAQRDGRTGSIALAPSSVVLLELSPKL